MPSDPHRRPVFLVGYRCTGKSTVGRLLATALSRPFLDTDEAVETRSGTTIADLVNEKGWQAFRELESRVLAELVLEDSPVVATGGGIILAQENREVIQVGGICIWLQADEEIIIKRLLGDDHSETLRPHLTDDSLEAETRKLLATRTPLYREVADFSIDTTAHSPEHCTQIILRRLDQ